MDGAQFQIVLVDESGPLPEAPSRDTSTIIQSSPPSKLESSPDRSGQAISQAGSHPTASPSERDGKTKDDQPRGKEPGHHLANELKHVSAAGISAANLIGLGGIVRDFQVGVHRVLTIIEGAFAAREIYKEYSELNLEEAHQQGAKQGEKQRQEIVDGHAIKRDPDGDDDEHSRIENGQQPILDRIASNTEPEHLDRMADKIVSGLSVPAAPSEIPEPTEPTKDVLKPESIPGATANERPAGDTSPKEVPVTLTAKQLSQDPGPGEKDGPPSLPKPIAKVQDIPLPRVEKNLPSKPSETFSPAPTDSSLEPQTTSDVVRDLLVPFKAMADWVGGKQTESTPTARTDSSKDHVFPPPVEQEPAKDDPTHSPLQITRTVRETVKDHSEIFGTKQTPKQTDSESPATPTKSEPPASTPSAKSMVGSEAFKAAQNVVAREAAGAAETTVAAEAAGAAGTSQAATGLRSALTALTLGVSTTTLVIGGIAAVAAGVVVGFKLVSDAARAEAERLEEYSGEIAKTMAEGDVRRELHRVERGQERGGTLASIVGAQDKLSLAFEKLGESLMDPLIDMLSTLVPVIEGIAYSVEKTSEGVGLTNTSVQLAAAYLADWLNLGENEAREDAKVREINAQLAKRWNEFLTDEKKKKLDDALQNDPMLNALNNAWGQPATIDKAVLKEAFEAALDKAGGGAH